MLINHNRCYSSSRQKQFSQKVAQLSKYKDLETEVTQVWKLKTKAIPVVVGALEMIKNFKMIKALKLYRSNPW